MGFKKGKHTPRKIANPIDTSLVKPFASRAQYGPITRTADVCGVTYVECVATYSNGSQMNITIKKIDHDMELFLYENRHRPLGLVWDKLEDLIQEKSRQDAAENEID